MSDDVARLIQHTIRHSQQREKFAEGGVPDYDPMSGAQIGGDPSEKPATDPQGRWSKFASRLTGTQFGEPRYQLWPEKMVRSGVSLAGDVLSGEQAVQPPGLRREDITDVPPPSAPTDDSTWLGRKLGVAPVGAQPNDPMMERAQDMAGLAGGQTLLTAARDTPAATATKGAAHVAAAEAPVDVGPGLAGPSGGTEILREAQLAAQRRSGSRQPLEGLPQGVQIVDGQPFVPGPVASAHDVAEAYMKGKDFGVPHPDRYHPIDVEHAQAIAKAFEEMPHAPNDPAVKAAYEALARETLDQYRAITGSGLKVTPVNAADYPYHGNPRAVVRDVADNNHMAFFKSREGFGTDYHADPDHPLLRSSGEKVGDHDMLYNDLFRVVHDYFGHVKNGYGFRGAGEDNAWRSHAAMYSPEARRAMTTETRGQNSWLNYGPHGEHNRTANAADTIYAEQKIGLLPDWVMQDRGAKLLSDSGGPGAPLAALEHAPKFYSGAERAVEAVPQQRMTGAQWIGTLSNKGAVKAEEMQWTGLGDFLLSKKNAPVTKAEVQEHLGANKLELGEVNLGERTATPWKGLSAGEQRAWTERFDRISEQTRQRPEYASPEDYYNREMELGAPVPGGTKYHDYQLPGGENYREKLLTLPNKNSNSVANANISDAELMRRGVQQSYFSSHWDEPNVLVHRRTNERDVTHPLSPEELQVVDARKAAQPKIDSIVQQQHAVAKEIQDTASPLYEAYRSKIFADIKAGRISRRDASRKFEEGFSPPEIKPLQDRLQELRAQEDQLRDSLPPEPKNSKRSLHIEEIQSDWHQQGRQKGYAESGRGWTAEKTEFAPGIRGFRVSDSRGNHIADVSAASADEAIASAKQTHSRQASVPDAPFKKNWHELALKDAIREAAEKGIDRISWTPGEAQAARYDLSKHVERVYYDPDVGTVSFDAKAGQRHPEPQYKVGPEKLADVVGKDVAEKLLQSPRDRHGIHSLGGLDLKVGGEGMKGFYDKMIPDALNKIGKPHGVKVEKGTTVHEGDRAAFNRAMHSGDSAAIADAAGLKTSPVHYMDIPPSLKEQALKKGFSLFEDSATAGAALAALGQQRKAKSYFEGDLSDVNAGVHSRPDRRVQTVADPYRMMFPGIYRNPKLIAEEAAARVGPEDPAMKQLFDVTRGDLRDMAQGRVGNEEPNLRLAANPRGSLAAQNIQTPHNTQRLVDNLIEAGKHEGLRTADAWYIMDPMYQRMKELYGAEQAAIRFRHLNTTTGMASPGSDVLTEIQRGTGAHWLQEQGRFNDFVKYGGLTGPARQSPKVPGDVRYIGGHPYHRTAQTEPMQKYFDTGSIQTDAAKVPLYVHASGVPETGFQTSGPVGDAHFSRGVGLADTRKGPTDVQGSFSKPEYQTLQPWWKDEVAGAAGLESVPAQARLWTTLGPQTGVESELGAPKLELFSKQIMRAARRLGVSPEKARDMILSGKAGAGARGGVARCFAPGGRIGYEDGGMTDDDAPVFNPARLAAVKPASPVFDPAKLATAKPREAAPMDAMDVVSGVIENAPASAWQFAKDVARPVTHPIETLSGIKDLGLGLLEKSGAIGTIFPSAGGGHEQYADAMGQYLKNRYGGLENIKRTVAKDPVGALSDASMVLTGGGSAAARLPGALGRAGEITGAVGRAVDPILAPVNAARAGTKAVGELMTHTGATPLENAYRTGVEGGEAGEVFRGQMRGTSEMTEPVQMAKEGLEGYRGVRARDYREGRAAMTSLDRQMAPQDRILDFGKIDDAVDRARKVQTFGTRVLDKGANEVRNSMISEINEWKALDPVEYHTIDGMDALKRSLGHMMMDTAPGTSARKAAGDIYNAVRKTIVEYDPKYAKVMKDYEQASTQIKELERSMSLGEKASADTALRKLQSIMRNNVNTNYGRRLELGKLLEENGATHLMAALSGQALNAWAPRGLGKLGAELAVIGGAGHFISPWTLAATPLMSPRLMGEVAHAAGRTAGRALEKTNKAFSATGLGGNRTAGNVSYRLGRATNQAENETNPYAP